MLRKWTDEEVEMQKLHELYRAMVRIDTLLTFTLLTFT